MIPDRATFDFYSDRNNFPGAMQVPEVKFVITDVDTTAPRLYFMNTKNYSYHYDFVVECLGWSIDLNTFNRQTYFSDHRKNLAGSLIAHDHYEPNEAIQGIYTMEFWPTDPVTFEFVRLAYELIQSNMPFATGKLYYHAPGETQRALYEIEKELYDESSVAVIRTEDLYANVSYTPLTTGQTYGRLRIIEGPEAVSARDVVVYRTLPNTLSHVAGIITEVPQTPLSHINLKAKQNHTPNAYIREAATLPEVAALAGRYVRFSVQPEGYTLEEATSRTSTPSSIPSGPKTRSRHRGTWPQRRSPPSRRLALRTPTASGPRPPTWPSSPSSSRPAWSRTASRSRSISTMNS